jgi:hypothetical protein
MSISKNLEATHMHAEQMLVGAYNPDTGYPITAESHTDLWPGDASRWVNGYLAIGKGDMAGGVLDAVGRSIRENGSIPHYMLGSHKRLGGIETNFIDRLVQKVSGNGLERTETGEWVTKAYAPATFGLAAAAATKAGHPLPKTLGLYQLFDAHNSLTVRRRNSAGLIEARNPNELTNNSGVLAGILKKNGSVVDPSINASYVQNGKAIAELWEGNGLVQDIVLADVRRTEKSLHRMIEVELEEENGLSLETVQAIARLGLAGMLRGDDLISFFEAPAPGTKHPERTSASLPDMVEVARLTASSFDESRQFLVRITGKLADGPQAFTRYEGVKPEQNVVANRAYRKQVWTQTAAEAVQITFDDLK